MIDLIRLNPELFPKSKNKQLRKALIDKNNYLVFKLNAQHKAIEIINFRGTKQQAKY